LTGVTVHLADLFYKRDMTIFNRTIAQGVLTLRVFSKPGAGELNYFQQQNQNPDR
jgi:hypothetical protein